MRKDYSRFDEAHSVRTYVHSTGKAGEFHDKGVKLLQSFLSGVSKPAQEMLAVFEAYKKAMGESQNLGKAKSSKSDITATLRNIMVEIYGKRFNAIDAKVDEVEKHLKALELLLNQFIGEDVSQALDDLRMTKRDLDRKTPKPAPKPRAPRTPKSPVPTPAGGGIDPEEAEYEAWKKNLPAEGTPEWDRWVAMRAHHIQQQKEKAHHRGDASKGDNLHGHDWWDHKAHWKQAHDEIQRYVKSDRDNKKFAWSKHFQDWRAHIGQALNEYYDLKAEEEKDFFRSIMPPRPSRGYM